MLWEKTKTIITKSIKAVNTEKNKTEQGKQYFNEKIMDFRLIHEFPILIC